MDKLFILKKILKKSERVLYVFVWFCMVFVDVMSTVGQKEAAAAAHEHFQEVDTII